MRCCLSCFDRIFDDKRICVCFLMFWLFIVIALFGDIGLFQTKFMHFGPTPTANFMGLALDSWYKWSMVACFVFFSTSINNFMSDAISPWILNTISDHKNQYLPYPKWTCLSITQTWAVYCNMMGVINLFIALIQIDFLLIRTAADLMVNSYTNLKFMRHKEYSPEKYYQLDRTDQALQDVKSCFSIDDPADPPIDCPSVVVEMPPCGAAAASASGGRSGHQRR